MQTRRVPLGDEGFFLILPGTWATIPLSSPEKIKRQVAQVVKQQIGTSDRLASRRRQFREELVKSATDARDQGAIAYAIALELMPGVPFSGAMITRRQPWPRIATALDGLAEPADRLRAAFPDATVLHTAAGPVARVATEGVQHYVTEETPSLRLEYWLPAPVEDGLLAMLISLPTAPDGALFTELFDSIVDSITWIGDSVEAADGGAAAGVVAGA